MKRNNFLLLAVAIFLVLTIPQVSRPLIFDEVVFLKAAEGALETGIPTAYMGELLPANIFFPHPPLYTYYLSSFVLLGLTYAIRLSSIIPILLTMALVCLTCRELGKKSSSSWKNLAILSLFIYIAIPLTVQGSLLIDIDNSLLTFFSSLLVYMFVKYEGDRRLPIYLGVVGGISLWIKFSLVITFLFSVFIYMLLTHKKMTALKTALLSLAISAAIFIPTWLAYAGLTGVDYLGPFVHNTGGIAHSFAGGLAHYLLISAGYSGIRTYFLWLTPALSLLLVYLYFKYYGVRSLKAGKWGFIVLYSFLTILQYVLVGQSPWKFPKYITLALPLVSILVAYYLIQNFSHKDISKRRDIYIHCIILIAPLLFYWIVIPDPLMPPATLSGSVMQIILYSIPLILPFTLGILYSFKAKTRRIAFGLFLVFVSTSVYVNTLHVFADYSTNYQYGDKGLLETISFVTANTAPSDFILAPGDVSYYSGRKYFEYLVTPENCSQELVQKNIKLAVLRTTWEVKRDTKLYACLKENYQETSIGDFRIFQINN